ncbi:MAG: hypothetical protein IJP22_00425 [Clostridia bacterium]|nr:hypothetical protein [Clostridia bacterium]
MENMSKEEFMRQSEAAVRRMREINSRANIKSTPHKMPPKPQFVSTPPPKEEREQEKKVTNEGMKNNGFSLPFLEMFKRDSDMPIILGLLLLLMSEKCDKRLLFALLYILM